MQSTRIALHFTALAALAVLIPQLSFATQISVQIQDDSFSPKNLTVRPGDTITWTNIGMHQHTITSDTSSIDSGTLSPGQSYALTFNSSGTLSYYCKFHGSQNAGMTGAVNIVSASTQQTQTSSGNASADALRAQIMDLLNRITNLQGQLGGSNSQTTQTTSTSGGGASEVACPLISRTLKRGSTGDDVTRLQRFLALDPEIYPEANVSGYYGALTEAAVKRFQCKNKLVCNGDPGSTGYGMTGPRTAALMALQCPDILGGKTGRNVGGFIKVTPITGNSPLQVAIEATVNTTKSCTAASYDIDFGDTSPAAHIAIPQNACSELRQVFTHTYTYGGAFSITLRSGIHQTAAMVNVSGQSQPPPGGSGDTFSAAPTSGAVPLTVNFQGLINASGACNAGPYTMQFGDGQTASLPLSGCTPSTYSVSHVYSAGGNFVAHLYRGTPAADLGSVAIAATGGAGGGGGFFSVSPGSSGDSFSVQVQFDSESSCAAYDLDWGDGSSHQTQSQGTCSAGTVSKQFTHDYTSSGNFTIVLKRGASLGIRDSASLVISQ